MIALDLLSRAKGGEGVKSGPIGLAVILVLCVAAYFLFKSMSKHLKRVREDFPSDLPGDTSHEPPTPTTPPTPTETPSAIESPAATESPAAVEDRAQPDQAQPPRSDAAP